MINRNALMKYPKLWLRISLGTVLVSLVIIFTIKPLWGIDFTGGSLLEIKTSADQNSHIRQVLHDKFDLSSSTQATQDGSIIIRIKQIPDDTKANILKDFKDEGIIKQDSDALRFETIGPTIGKELRQKTAISVSLVVLVMIIYLAYTFRHTKKLIAPWKFGVAAAWALAHDLILVTAIFVIFGKLWGAAIDTLFVTAQLAILGYSVNDTIVLFDRLVRERTTNKNHSLLEIMNKSIAVTLGRSLNTSFTTLLTLFAILIFGGSTIRWFIATLVAGTITGAYSSIFVAPPLLWYLSRKRGKK